MIRFLKSTTVAVVISLMTTASLLADGFMFYDFECERMGLVRSRDRLVFSGNDPTVGKDIVFACEGRSCVQRERWDDGSGNTGVRVRSIYFPRGTMEYVSVSASWRDGEDVPYHHLTYVNSLLPCGF